MIPHCSSTSKWLEVLKCLSPRGGMPNSIALFRNYGLKEEKYEAKE
jgi:hypothetical protein